MRLRERLIHFQNIAERDFEKSKTLGNSIRYTLAFLLFMGSTIFAGMTWPIRALLKRKSTHAMPGIHTMTQENANDFLSKEPLVLLDFWAEWCGPCIMMNPILEAFAQEEDRICIAKVNADTQPELVNRFKIRGLPQMVLIQNGNEVKRHGGAMTRKELETFCFDK